MLQLCESDIHASSALIHWKTSISLGFRLYFMHNLPKSHVSKTKLHNVFWCISSFHVWCPNLCYSYWWGWCAGRLLCSYSASGTSFYISSCGWRTAFCRVSFTNVSKFVCRCITGWSPGCSQSISDCSISHTACDIRLHRNCQYWLTQLISLCKTYRTCKTNESEWRSSIWKSEHICTVHHTRCIFLLTSATELDAEVNDAFENANTADDTEHYCRQENERHYDTGKFRSRHFYKY